MRLLVCWDCKCIGEWFYDGSNTEDADSWITEHRKHNFEIVNGIPHEPDKVKD